MKKNQLLGILPLVFVIGFSSVPAYAIRTVEIGGFKIDFYNDGEQFSWNSEIESNRDWTEEQISLTETAFSYWGNLVQKATGSRNVKVALAWGELGEGTIGMTGMPLIGYNNQLMTPLEGIWKYDRNFEDGYDFIIQFSEDFNFSYNLSGPETGKVDYYSVILHEIGHNFGFNSSVWSDALYWGVEPTAFDSLMLCSDDNSRATSTSYAPGKDYILENTGLGVYNPGVWAEGSSMSHVTGDDLALMQYSIGEGVRRDGLSDSEIALMREMCWTIIPEPSFFALFAGTLSLALTGTRRRRRK